MQEHRQTARIAVVMGVLGSGKTAIGRAPVHRLQCSFEVGDALYPPDSIANIRTGRRSAVEPSGAEENPIAVSVEPLVDRLVSELSHSSATTPSRVESNSFQGA